MNSIAYRGPGGYYQLAATGSSSLATPTLMFLSESPIAHWPAKRMRTPGRLTQRPKYGRNFTGTVSSAATSSPSFDFKPLQRTFAHSSMLGISNPPPTLFGYQKGSAGSRKPK